MAEIKSQEQYEKVKAALQAGEFSDDLAIQDEVLAAAEAWAAANPSTDNRMRGYSADQLPTFGPGGFFEALGGVGELGLTGVTGLADQIWGGLKGAATMLGGPYAGGPQAVVDRAVGEIEGQQGRMTYEPRGATGQAIQEGIGEAVAPVAPYATDLFETPYPLLSTLLKTSALGALEVGGLKGASRAIPKIPASQPGALIPSIKDLYAAGRVAFNEARLNGNGIIPEAANRLRQRVSSFRNEAGIEIRFSERQHPQAAALRDELIEDIEAGRIDFDSLLEHRELAGDLAGNADKALAMRGMLVKNAIDEFVDSLKPSDVVSGNPVRAAQSLETARALWRDASKARTIEREIELAGNRAGQFSGSGYENALRTQFRQLKARIIKGQEKGWTPDEIDAITKVANGGKMDNVWRMLGKLAPTGVVSGGIGAGIGYTAFGPLGAAAVPAGGALSRHLATRGTIGNAQRALELPLTRSLLDIHIGP